MCGGSSAGGPSNAGRSEMRFHPHSPPRWQDRSRYAFVDGSDRKRGFPPQKRRCGGLQRADIRGERPVGAVWAAATEAAQPVRLEDQANEPIHLATAIGLADPSGFLSPGYPMTSRSPPASGHQAFRRSGPSPDPADAQPTRKQNKEKRKQPISSYGVESGR